MSEDNQDQNNQEGPGRRSFTKEFKHEVVSILLESGRTTKDVAEEYNIREGLLGKWKTAYLAEQKKTTKKAVTVSTPKAVPEVAPQQPSKADQEELVKLRLEVRQLRSDNNVLRSALAVFARETF